MMSLWCQICLAYQFFRDCGLNLAHRPISPQGPRDKVNRDAALHWIPSFRVPCRTCVGVVGASDTCVNHLTTTHLATTATTTAGSRSGLWGALWSWCGPEWGAIQHLKCEIIFPLPLVPCLIYHIPSNLYNKYRSPANNSLLHYTALIHFMNTMHHVHWLQQSPTEKQYMIM